MFKYNFKFWIYFSIFLNQILYSLKMILSFHLFCNICFKLYIYIYILTVQYFSIFMSILSILSILAHTS